MAASALLLRLLGEVTLSLWVTHRMGVGQKQDQSADSNWCKIAREAQTNANRNTLAKNGMFKVLK